MITKHSVKAALGRMRQALRRWRGRDVFHRYYYGVPCAATRRRLLRQIRSAWRETDS